jgi:NAD(P)-dependent dehydrogenase (short-subunit alcohol dehydrogenase family)
MGERLKGKVAIVTGAGSMGPGLGNGKAAAIIFAREGAKVMLVDINAKAAEETKSIIDKEGGQSIAFKANVTSPADCQEMVETCIQTFGRVDILHNNVGILGAGGALDTTEELWDKVINVNLKSMFLTCRHTIPYMLKQGRGAIINVSSVGGIRTTSVPLLSYAVSKNAIIAFTNEIAIEFAAKGIRANCVLPGLIKTPMVEFSYDTSAWGSRDIEEMWRKRDAMSPTGRQGEAWDIANAALFLASDESKYVNGVSLLVDGGLTGTTKIFK